MGNEVKNKDSGGYFSYYCFVVISAILGFVAVFFSTRLFIDKIVVDDGSKLMTYKAFLPMGTAVLAVILFMLIAISLKAILKKILLSELFLYLYMGFLTTVVNIICFTALLNYFNANTTEGSPNWKVAEVIAFTIAVIFAFITNKIFVFRSYSFVPTKFFSEFGLFLGGRLFTELINFLMMIIMIDKLKIDEVVTKIAACIVVVIINYIISKFFIFKKPKAIINTIKEEAELDTTQTENKDEQIAKDVELNESKTDEKN